MAEARRQAGSNHQVFAEGTIWPADKKAQEYLAYLKEVQAQFSLEAETKSPIEIEEIVKRLENASFKQEVRQYWKQHEKHHQNKEELEESQKLFNEARDKIYQDERAKLEENVKSLEERYVEISQIKELFAKKNERLASENERLKEAKAEYDEGRRRMEEYKASVVWDKMNEAERKAYRAGIDQFRSLVQNRSEKVSAIRAAINQRETEILAAMPQNVHDKINEISLGILEKNLPKKKAFDLAELRLKEIQSKMERAKSEMETVKERLANECEDQRYRVKRGEEISLADTRDRISHYDGGIASIIAEALSGDPAVINAVMKEADSDDGKTWSELSWEEKEERRLKEQDRYI